MRRVFLLLSLFVFAAAPALAQKGGGAAQKSPYAGEEKREIKSLSPEEVESLLKGEGMAQAKVAELNHYPGPKHVLELADKLKLTEQQRQHTRHIYQHMHTHATRIGALIVSGEKDLEQLFASGEADYDKLWEASRGIALLRGELRTTHLSAHIDMKNVLTPEQVKLYDKLRGYNAPGASQQKHQRKH